MAQPHDGWPNKPLLFRVPLGPALVQAQAQVFEQDGHKVTSETIKGCDINIGSAESDIAIDSLACDHIDMRAKL